MMMQWLRGQLRLSAGVMILASAVGMDSSAGAADAVSATVTATPPAQAPVKPLTAVQARQRCELEARQQHVSHPQRPSFIASCVKQKSS